jgi:hypothetical protein
LVGSGRRQAESGHRVAAPATRSVDLEGHQHAGALEPDDRLQRAVDGGERQVLRLRALRVGAGVVVAEGEAGGDHLVDRLAAVPDELKAGAAAGHLEDRDGAAAEDVQLVVVAIAVGVAGVARDLQPAERVVLQPVGEALGKAGGSSTTRRR